MMRTRNGCPTQKEIIKLLDKYDMVVNSFDGVYPKYGISYSESGQTKANEKAALIVEEIRAAGFVVEHRLADTSKALNGAIRIKPK